jgi:hypothetical protein
MTEIPCSALALILCLLFVKRNGYKFWCPDVFSDFGKVISPAFLRINLPELFISGLPALAFTAICVRISLIRGKTGLPRDKRETARSLLYYILIGTGPIIILHLIYFWYDQRFFLPALVLLAALTGGLFGRLVENRSGRLLVAVQVACLLAALIFRLARAPPEPARRLTADRINDLTPSDALIISGIDPAYLEHFSCGKTKRRILPLSRNVDYTSTSITWRTSCSNMTAGFKPGVYPYVAEERPDLVAEDVGRGAPVFLDTSQILDEDLDAVRLMADNFTLIEKGLRLYELKLKK